MPGLRTSSARALLATAVGGPLFAGAVGFGIAAPSAHAASHSYYYDYGDSHAQGDDTGDSYSYDGNGSGPNLVGPVTVSCLQAGDKVTFIGTAFDDNTGFVGSATEQFTCPESLFVTVQQKYPTIDGVDGNAGNTDQMTGTITEVGINGLVVASYTQSESLIIG